MQVKGRNQSPATAWWTTPLNVRFLEKGSNVTTVFLMANSFQQIKSLYLELIFDKSHVTFDHSFRNQGLA